MRRREVIGLLGGAAMPWSRPTGAQQATHVPIIGALIPFPESDSEAQGQMAVFRDALQKLGRAHGQTVRLEERWAGGDVAKLRILAKELVALRPDVILTRSTPVTAAVLQETRTVPIVFVVVSDPVGDGFVASMSRPGGNATGFTNVEASLAGKWLELLKEIEPDIKRVAVMFGPKTAPGGGSYYLQLVDAAARSINVKMIAAPVHDDVEVERALVAFAREPQGALIVTPDLTTTVVRASILRGTLQGGEKPSNLPVQGPTKFELVINLKTAKMLGLAVPSTLLTRADEVIE